MISRDTCMQVILNNVPEFQERWGEHLSYWDGEPAGLCNDMAAFCSFTINQINKGQTQKLQMIFDLIEHLMVNGDQDVKNAVATCFLENLLNSVSSGKLSSLTFVPLLGPESRKHCLAWDEFTGVHTDGL